MASQEELVELLIDGARFGDADDVHKALEGKVDVNAQDEWGKTGELGAGGQHACSNGGSAAAVCWPAGAATCCMLLQPSDLHVHSHCSCTGLIL